MSYGSNRSSLKPLRSVKLDLILMMRDMYIDSNLDPFTIFSISRKSTDFKNIIQEAFYN